jgi:hypothetical protein
MHGVTRHAYTTYKDRNIKGWEQHFYTAEAIRTGFYRGNVTCKGRFPEYSATTKGSTGLKFIFIHRGYSMIIGIQKRREQVPL